MKKFYLPVLLAAIVFVSGCRQKSQKEVLPDTNFGKYINAFTSGTVSVTSFVSVNLTKPVSQEIIEGKQLFKFSPDVKGETILSGNRMVEFHPTDHLKPGTKYSVEFLLGEIFEVEKEFKKMPFQFSTINPAFSVSLEGLFHYGKSTYDKMQLKGYILTADVMGAAQTEKFIKAEYVGEEMAVNWRHDLDGRKHFFTVDSLTRDKNNSSVLLVKWNGKSSDIENKGEEKIEVPALNSFEIIEAKVVNAPEQHIEIRFSDPLQKGQDLTGMVSLKNGIGLRTEVEGNVIKAWPAEVITEQAELLVYEGIRNNHFYKLLESESFLLQFSSLKPEVRLIGKGVIVPQGNSLEMPFEAVGLNAVEIRVIQIFQENIFRFFQENSYPGSSDLKKVGRLVYSGKLNLTPKQPDGWQHWNTYKVNLASLFNIKQGAIYRVEFRIKKAYSEFTCNTNPDENDPEISLALNTENYQTEWDRPGWYSQYYYPPGYRWDERDNPCHVSYYNSDRFASRNIFASELGITAKEGRDHNMHFIVSNLLTAEPEKGVKLELFNFQNQLLVTLQTDENGMAAATLEKKPFMLFAQKGDQFGYLRLDDGSSLSTSNFNVSGSEIKDGIKGFIYGERGVWRPGDSIFINFILEKAENGFPADYPVVFKLLNPSEQVVDQQVVTKNIRGFYSFRPVTKTDAPTGNWRVEASVGNVTFSKRIKIEAIKPNRLSIELNLPKTVLSAYTNQIPVSAAWLHGTPARNLKTKVDILFTKDQTTFEGFEDYTFTNPASFFQPVEQTIYEGRLDDKGETTVPFGLFSPGNAPGMLKVWFTSRVFEEGGDFSTNVTQAKFAPFEIFVGVKMPASEDNWYKTDTDYQPEIVLVDKNGNPVSGSDIEAKLYKIDWRWWWESGEENLAHYVSGRYYNPVKTWSVENAGHKTRLNVNVKYRNWEDNGRYLLWVKDMKSGHAAGTTFYLSKWGGWRSGDSPEGATMLTLKTDKEKYQVGESIEVKIPSSKNGRALVSIENGTRVSDLFWVKTNEKETSFYIEAKPEYAPNFYIYVSLIQPYGQTENDAPLRLYGITPVLVENQETILQPEIDAPTEIKPESEYSVRISEKNNKPMTYTLAVVDEGLLGLTNFKTPDPHSVFYAREALGVKTWDLFDYVAGAYGAALEKAFAIGGAGELETAGKNEISRFKPVVKFVGPFELKKGKTNKHNLNMTNYVGAVRVMVVAGENGAYGHAEKNVPVRKEVMLLATLPRVLAPKEEVSLPVNVFVMKENVKSVDIRLKTNNLLEVVEEPEQTVSFSGPDEKMAWFRLKVKEQTGIASVEIEAESSKEKASYQVNLEVRNPNQKVTVEKSAMINGQENRKTEIVAPGEKGTNSAWMEVSGFPSLNLSKHLDFLINYPHGCVEQVTSAAFPQLFLEHLTELTADEKLEVADHVRVALETLMDFQLPNGGFSYWPGSPDINQWGTNYAGHFLMAAENAGFSLPLGLKEKWMNYQKTAARNWSPSEGFRNGVYYRNYDLTQAYRLFTLALAGSPDLGAMNRLRERGEKTAEITWRLAAAYVLAGQSEAAEKMVTGIPTDIHDYSEFSGTFGSALRDKAMVLESLVLLNEQENAFEMLKEIANQMNEYEWLSTQTAAWCLSAASGFAQKFKMTENELKFEVTANGENTKLRTEIPVVKIPVTPDNQGKVSVDFNNESQQPLFLKVIAQGIPAGVDSSSFSNNLLLGVKYFDSANREFHPSQIEQGEDFRLEVTVKHPGQRTAYEEMVLTTVFPSGWEIINQRVNDIPQNQHASFEYQDIRDDRVFTYFDLNMNQQKTFVFRLNAAYSGKFYLPPVHCGAMYDFSVRAQNSGFWVEVE